MPHDLPPFSAPYAPPDEELAAVLLAGAPKPSLAAETQRLGRELLSAMRAAHSDIGGVEDFLHEFSLSSREGLAVMALAESLLRVPDDATLDRLLADRLSAGEFDRHKAHSETLLTQACAFALGLSTRLIAAEESPSAIAADLARRLGAPALRLAARQAMRVMGSHFVFGETIDAALERARGRGLHSFDMLGEAARMAEDAERYFSAYAEAIRAIGASDAARDAGISVKLSALHPRYEAISRERVLKELTPRLLELARLAKSEGVQLTVDAEEADRLELSLEVFARALSDGSLVGWNGFGLAVQAYQKRAAAVIDYAAALAESRSRRLNVRLVKGAYWDSEIKRAQERGLPDYPVFTRKAMTDINYLACARRLFDAPRLYPQFATHNALTVASILAEADRRPFEFQRLHGMGEALSEATRERFAIPWRVYAPVGPHRDLLAYLVRRLIENGANSSFVARAADPATPPEVLLADPYELIASPKETRNRRLRAPADIYRPLRANSKGVEFGERAGLDALLTEIEIARKLRPTALPSQPSHKERRACRSPIDGKEIGSVIDSDGKSIEAAMAAAQHSFDSWAATSVVARAWVLDRTADLIEARRASFIALLQEEAGKTLDDALGEVREAADLCRYYAAQARELCTETALPGPTGEASSLRRCGRGVFVCVSPWNFPLAIFIGQVAAALAAGNSAIAKPAEQTPLVAFEAVSLLHEAGVPQDVLQFAPGGGDVGAALVEHPCCAGVVFTGSLEVAKSINRALAQKPGAIVPLIAETGGVNAMIVDSTALPETVADDVLTSAFRSAGQRCSALRVLCLQEEIAGGCTELIAGAAAQLRIGDPRDLGVHLGPVIDAEAKERLEAYLAGCAARGRIIYAGEAPAAGCFVAPHIVRLDRLEDLKEEVFGPVLHVVRWRAEAFDALVEAIARRGSGLTMGLETRIERRRHALGAMAPAGNIYVNRNMIGAAVGGQPFGGFGLSGTGPKAGGPDYLRRFMREITVTVNTAAAGGDAGLMAMED
ncbi:bifunctional proline dehydrogenase/L-glutamate gamma-semialdehyde dehydrogenase PutA [Methylocystis heyeri]|uniref:Bifunctional protein PutA n=1 Tax=Methylocystis heyeri TaxID=391905 RepID=A0A6B8KG97_9HYPH|nr:bifunctional proline dehydrogenase/L-glutamate gamma-semialdehyde dehydrogenase PutA [Methylocystis heyeri]QGM45578.1 bifunctional proline dehydrogenase/L-glutamate gamma-semialdehyde dehydrogenase PutA [Methylocystis heyeri]